MGASCAGRSEPGLDNALPGWISSGDDGRDECIEWSAAHGASFGASVQRTRANERCSIESATSSSGGMAAPAIFNLCRDKCVVGDACAVARLEGLAGLGAADFGFLGGT